MKTIIELREEAIEKDINPECYLYQKLEKQQQVIDKIKEIVNKAPCLWYVDEEIERVDGTIDLIYEEYISWKDILELLEEIE